MLTTVISGRDEEVAWRDIYIFTLVAISEILGIFEGSHGSHPAVPEPICLPTVTQARHERAVQRIGLVHADELCTVLQTTYDLLRSTFI